MTNLKMITQYQENGLLQINQLKNLTKDYDALIEESQRAIDKAK